MSLSKEPRSWIATARALFSKKSLALLLLLGVTYLVIALFFPHLIDWDAEPDFLLGVIWVFMTLAIIARPKLSRDLKLALVALFGGLVIEGWGTNTLLWTYYTDERPPLWILPAWPIAAIAIDRLADGVEHLFPKLKRLGTVYWLVLPAFILLFTTLMMPALIMPSSIGVLLLMLGVTCIGVRPERDMILFLTGASLGVLLEYWGTSRQCWTYWTEATPPYQAVLAHGFASIAFARGVQALEAVVALLLQAQRPVKTSIS